MDLQWAGAPWPWYVAGPLIGLFVPVLLLVGNKVFGVSSNLRHICSAVAPGEVAHFRYDWKAEGLWNLLFAAGICVGGVIAGLLWGTHDVVIAPETKAALETLGIRDFGGLAPVELFSWGALASLKGLAAVVLGGFLVGFGTAYAGGCTSGHAISGLADGQLPSLVAVMGFFAGGLLGTFVVWPLILGGLR